MASKPTTKKYPIGLALPIKNSGESGFFDQTTDTFTQIRTNIINLIRTKPGERRMQPSFGCRIWETLFDQKDEFLPEKIKNIIKDDISKWVPGVSVSDINLRESNEKVDGNDIYKLYISVKFIIDSVNREDIVDLVITTNKI